mmetsp:Transcript_6407/g.13953  ORF Transcript_6407/g.13953 Transcript_6407/m.13953 type:complete len:86 (-) Transcript_6407:2745-3002(-)
MGIVHVQICAKRSSCGVVLGSGLLLPSLSAVDAEVRIPSSGSRIDESHDPNGCEHQLDNPTGISVGSDFAVYGADSLCPLLHFSE